MNANEKNWYYRWIGSGKATADYYKRIIQGVDEVQEKGSLNYPEIIIYSVNMSYLIGLINAKRYQEVCGSFG